MQTRDEQERLNELVTDEPAPARTTFNAADLPGRVGPQLQATLNLVPAHTWYANASGVLTFLNERGSDYIGLPKGHPLRLGIGSGGEWDSHIALLHPDDHEVTRRVWSTCLRTGCAGQVSFRVRNAEGGYRSFLSRAEPVRASDGALLYWIGINFDIEDRKQAEFYLAEGQRLGHAGSWSFKPDGAFDYCSRELYNILGFEPDAGFPTISRYLTRIHPEDRNVVEATIQRMIAAGEGCDLKKRIIRPDGVQRVIRCVGMPVQENGVVTRFVGTLMDITEQEDLTQELRRSQAYLAEAQRLSHTGSSAHNPATGKIHYWSEETYRIWGFDPRQPPPDSSMILERIHPEDRDRARAGYLNAVLERKDYDHEYRIVRSDGAIRNVQIVGHPVFSASGDLIEYVSTHMDITEHKLAEDAIRSRESALQQTRVELERVNRVTTMGELAASIAHEVNQPLVGVVTSANAALNWLAGGPANLLKTREAIERILRDGTRAGEVLTRIRAFLRRTSPAKSVVCVNHAVRDVLALVTGELRQHNIQTVLNLDPSLPAVLGDTIQLQQVLLNLIKNAIEAMVGIADRQRILKIESRLGEREGNPAVMLEVSDTGVGFNSAGGTSLFEAFHTTKPQGMGMGLWISRSIVESNGGCLTASSHLGPGATFVIMLPKASQDH
jgi:PAS domain S-box-containing protein